MHRASRFPGKQMSPGTCVFLLMVFYRKPFNVKLCTLRLYPLACTKCDPLCVKTQLKSFFVDLLFSAYNHPTYCKEHFVNNIHIFLVYLILTE